VNAFFSAGVAVAVLEAPYTRTNIASRGRSERLNFIIIG